MSDILSWNRVETQKKHKCFGCGKEYPKESSMVRATYRDRDTTRTCHWCWVCWEYMSRYFEYGDETEFGDIYKNDPEGWEELREEMEEKP